MELDVRTGNKSISIVIEDPFRLNLDDIIGRIEKFLADNNLKLNGLDVRGLLPRMVKGIAGCEAGCPSDARGVVRKGHKDFKLEYIEGGILSASAEIDNGKTVSLKLFPDF